MQSRTNQKRALESLSSLASKLGVSNSEDTIQINNNMQTFVIVKVQYGFGEVKTKSKLQ